MSERVITLADLRCDDCAFRPGTEANQSEWTKIKARLCAEIPAEFLCHRRPGLYAGWAALANELNAQGFHAGQTEWQRRLKESVLEIMHRIEDGEQIDLIDEIRKAMTTT